MIPGWRLWRRNVRGEEERQKQKEQGAEGAISGAEGDRGAGC
jgi:hypothetical protein